MDTGGRHGPGWLRVDDDDDDDDEDQRTFRGRMRVNAVPLLETRKYVGADMTCGRPSSCRASRVQAPTVN